MAGRARGVVMTVAEYLSVFLAILVGLAVADLATSFHKLMRARERVEWDWISLALALVMLLEIVLFWWGSFHWYRTAAHMSIGKFLPDLLLFILLFLAVAAVLPDEVPADGLSLRKHYFATAPYFWTLMVLMAFIVVFAVGPRYAPGASLPELLLAQWQNIALAAAMALLIFIRRPWLHMGFVALLVPYTLWLTLPYLMR
jgi:hypothetical protein